MHSLAKKYLRTSQLPFLFCPGCGDGSIVRITLQALDELGVFDQTCLACAIGCSSWMAAYFDTDYIKLLHGRTLPAAIALKMTDPSRKVLVFAGDGDCLAIGGNHFIHACRKNIDITMIMVNNQIYGMTGGQVSPTTPIGAATTTSPYGNLEQPLDACELARVSGATFVSRWSTAHPKQLLRTIKKAITHPGFSFVEVTSQCPVQSGRYVHGSGDPVELLNWIRRTHLTRSQMEKLSPEEREGKVLVGDFLEVIKPEFSTRTYEMVSQLQRRAAERA